jgi:hypothetical protein
MEKMKDRLYYCEECGKQEIHKTNHAGDIYPYCNYCVKQTTWIYIRDIDWKKDEGISGKLQPGTCEVKVKFLNREKIFNT